MIPEDAIWILELIRNRDARTEAEKDAVNAAIEALKAQLSHEGATSDTISRQAVLDALDAGAELLRRVLDDADIVGVERAKYEWGLDQIEAYIADVKELPPAQHERKRGKWLADNRPGGGFWVCSCCKFPSEAFAANVLYKFCPNCGADMRGEQE